MHSQRTVLRIPRLFNKNAVSKQNDQKKAKTKDNNQNKD